LVAVITHGTAVLGLGNIGALASKPVMEGKCVLFKKFANIDSIDLEVDELDVDAFVDTVARLEPSFGGINLEDIKAPECFEIEERLRERMNIPVFHDDQHGTAIIVGAAFTNWLHYTGRDIKDIKLICSGAGAAAIACLTLILGMGLPKENIIVCDRDGPVYKGRNKGMDKAKEKFANDTDIRTLDEAIKGADVFLGLSGPGAVSKQQIGTMEKAPLIMALANPTPEIMPDEVREVQPEAIICTGRSDFPNQVNNVLCFPFIFRGALDVGATAINEEMKLACVAAIAELARKEAAAEVVSVYSDEQLEFGPEYLIPKPFDPRLISELPPKVAQAAMDTGVATRPITDMARYIEKLEAHSIKTSMVMRPIFARAKQNPKRVAYCEGEEEKVLRAIQSVVDDGLAKPIVIGRRKVVDMRIKKLRLRLDIDKDIEICDPEKDPRYHDYWTTYHELLERQGVTPSYAKALVRTNATVIGALMLNKGDADAVICGAYGRYKDHLKHVKDIIGVHENATKLSALTALITNKSTIFITDTHVNVSPSVEEIVENTMLAAEEVRRFGIIPRVAMITHSNFGSRDSESAKKMGEACRIIKALDPSLEIDGEMHADVALRQEIRKEMMPNSSLKENANLLVMPNLDAANVGLNLTKALTDGISIGPLILGTRLPMNILTPSTSARGIVNLTAMATVAAQAVEKNQGHIVQQTLFNKSKASA
jgi:malate dehydrogenase (oxaloacetate-decarboxylating)(NADP+)